MICTFVFAYAKSRFSCDGVNLQANVSIYVSNVSAAFNFQLQPIRCVLTPVSGVSVMFPFWH